MTGQGGACPASGSVNTWTAEADTQFSDLAGKSIGPWPAPACAVQESMNSWPSQFAGLAYQADVTPASFTASDGVSGQPYVLVGAPVTAAEGGLTQSSTDVPIPGFGPSLDFTRTYDAQLARQQTVSGVPGQMGYGWTDNWAASLTSGSPVPGDIYTLDGHRTDTGQGGPPASAPLNSPGTVYRNNGDTYIVDTAGNRVEEIPAATGTQWGQWYWCYGSYWKQLR